MRISSLLVFIVTVCIACDWALFPLVAKFPPLFGETTRDFWKSKMVAECENYLSYSQPIVHEWSFPFSRSRLTSVKPSFHLSASFLPSSSPSPSSSLSLSLYLLFLLFLLPFLLLRLLSYLLTVSLGSFNLPSLSPSLSFLNSFISFLLSTSPSLSTYLSLLLSLSLFSLSPLGRS